MLASGVDQPTTDIPGPQAGASMVFLPATPFVYRQIQEQKKRATKCWLLVALSALMSWIIGNYLAQYVLSIFVLMGFGLGGSLTPEVLDPALFGGQMLASLGLSILSFAFGAIFPVLTVLWAVATYRRSYNLTHDDLVRTDMSLMLVDEQYSQLIEDLKKEKFRPRLFPVDLQGGFEGKLRHFAYYYTVYYRLSYGFRDPQVPQVMGGNCWFDGTVLTTTCCCCLPVSIWFFIRSAVMWPRILGVYKGVLDFLNGRFDAELEERWTVKQ